MRLTDAELPNDGRLDSGSPLAFQNCIFFGQTAGYSSIPGTQTDCVGRLVGRQRVDDRPRSGPCDQGTSIITGEVIEMDHILRGTQREYEKIGKLWNAKNVARSRGEG